MTPHDDLTVLNDNLCETHLRLSHLVEAALIHSEELTGTLHALHAAAADERREQSMDTTMGELHSLFLEQRANDGALPFSPLPELQGSVALLLRTVGVAERIAFCRALAATPAVPADTSALLQELFGRTEPVGKEVVGRVAYQRNIFADEAYLQFSHYIHAPRAAYYGSFAGVCEQVYNGLCEYCILPLENSRDGKLLRFYGLIQKYDLKIALTADVAASDKRQLTTFALCKRSLQMPVSMLYGLRGDACLELIFRQDSEDAVGLGDLLFAAEACSLRLIRADCLPRSDDEIMVGAGYPFNISFDVEGGDLRTFLLFLALDAPYCLPLGIYHHL